MSNLPQSLFNGSATAPVMRRAGVEIQREQGLVQLHRPSDQATATVLLPDSLPLEQKAVSQLLDFAAVHSPNSPLGVQQACATPDFHPGALAPVGAIVATDLDFLIPAAIGTDINCGMRMLTTGLTLTELESQRQPLLSKLSHALLENGRNLPLTGAAFATLFDSGPQALLEHLPQDGLWQTVDRPRLHAELAACIGLTELGGSRRFAPEALLPGKREIIRDPCLGTLGSGNHFVELQVVDSVLDRHAAYRAGLRVGDAVVMIHSGSRDLGFFVGQRWMDKAKAAWPVGCKHPVSGLYPLIGSLAQDYLQAMGVAARYAWLNRMTLAEMIRACFRSVFDSDRSQLVVDVPHNIILTEQERHIHRKGATPARPGDWALIPGSMGDYSYLALGQGHPDWLNSCSHGAGRRTRRQAMHRERQQHNDSALPHHCITLKEERRREEAPAAYKPVTPIIDIQAQHGLIQPVARFRPWVTFKA